jgi:hypothetical protein
VSGKREGQGSGRRAASSRRGREGAECGARRRSRRARGAGRCRDARRAVPTTALSRAIGVSRGG